MEEQKDLNVESYKVFEGFLVINYKNGEFRAMKKEPSKSKLTPWEIPIKIHLKIKTPKREEISINGEIEVSETKMGEMFMEGLKETDEE